MTTQLAEITSLPKADCYQFIAGENMDAIIISNQVLAGSKIIASSYNQVVFSEAKFFACNFQGVTFENCIFENISFEFCHLKECIFINCSFVNCNWVASSANKLTLRDSFLSDELKTVIGESNNSFITSRLTDHTTDIYIELLAA